MKQNQISVDDFYAEDVFEQWTKLIQKAEKSVTIYSPFLNEAINELLKKGINSEVEIKIVTRLDAECLCGNVNKIKALIEEIRNRNAIVYHLDKLHAKILIVDNKFVSIGSQNYTDQGRKNKEVSFVSKASFLNSKFLEEIEEWEKQAKSVSEKYLNDLYENISEDCLDFQKRMLKLNNKIEEIREKLERHEREFVTKGFATLTRYYRKSNLQCRHNEQLTTWKKKNTNMRKGAYYPIINLDTKQMIFARVNKRGITFVVNEKNLEEEVQIGDKSFCITIIFPELEDKELKNNMPNIIMSFNGKTGSDKIIRLKYFFDGKSFNLKSNRNSKSSEKRRIIHELESNRNILYSFFEPFRAGIQKDHISDKFAIENKYKAKIKIIDEIEIIHIESMLE